MHHPRSPEKLAESRQIPPRREVTLENVPGPKIRQPAHPVPFGLCATTLAVLGFGGSVGVSGTKQQHWVAMRFSDAKSS